MTTSLTPQAAEQFDRWLASECRTARMLTEFALDKLKEAERRLAHIREQLMTAAEGRPYYRVDSIDTSHVQAVFAAFSAIESIARLQMQRDAMSVESESK